MSRPRLTRRRDLLRAGLAAAAGASTGWRARRAGAAAPEPLGDAIVVDVHCHTFCAADLPIVGFVAHYIPGLTDLSRELTRWPEMIVRAVVQAVAALPNAASPSGTDELAALRAARDGAAPVAGVPAIPGPFVDDVVDRLAGLFPFSVGGDTRKLLGRYLDTLYLVSHPRAALAATLAEAYPSVSLFTPSLVDYDAWSEDRAPTPLATQILIHEQISRLSVLGKIGRPDARIHPFVAFDPRREAEARTPAPPPAAPPAAITPASTALEMVRYAIETAGFLGVKVYPAVGFAPLDNVRLRPGEVLSGRLDAALHGLYAYCQAQEVPITTHASAENEYALGLHELVAPERWRPVLTRYPGLRLNFGHFGQDVGLDDRLGVRAPGAWIRQAAALMQWYPNVYADLSGSPLGYDPAYAARFGGYLREIAAAFPRVKKRLMYGSDWWLARLEPGASGYLDGVRQALLGLFRPEEVADIMGRNALRFLGLLDEDNRPRPGRSARRLRKLYAGSNAPAWLG